MNRKLGGVFFLVFITTVQIFVCGWVLRPNDEDGAISTIDTFHSLEENTLDVIIYGSSVAWKGFDANELYKRYGYQTYNYGCNWQALNTTLLFLEDSLRTQKPKVACIELTKIGEIEKDVDVDGQIYYTRAIPYFDGKQRYLNQCFNKDLDRFINYYIPLSMCHDNWEDFNFSRFRKGQNHWIDSMGYNGSDRVKDIGEIELSPPMELVITQDTYGILERMLEICRENNVDILFYVCPTKGAFYYNDIMERYASERGIEYINLYKHIDEIGLNTSSDYQDANHLNNSGAKKLAKYLGGYIEKMIDGKEL